MRFQQMGQGLRAEGGHGTGSSQGQGHRSKWLFGRFDLHHGLKTVMISIYWPPAFNGILNRIWPYGTFVHWFVSRNLRTGPGMIGSVLERTLGAGADFRALGL